MKITHTSVFVFLFIVLMFVLVIANFSPPIASAKVMMASSLQTTPTPIEEDISVIGSTDGIMLMGVIISLIVTIPVLFRRKKN